MGSNAKPRGARSNAWKTNFAVWPGESHRSKSRMLSQAQRTTILELSAQGVSKHEIARMLGISRLTVRKVVRSNSNMVPEISRGLLQRQWQILQLLRHCIGVRALFSRISSRVAEAGTLQQQFPRRTRLQHPHFALLDCTSPRCEPRGDKGVTVARVRQPLHNRILVLRVIQNQQAQAPIRPPQFVPRPRRSCLRRHRGERLTRAQAVVYPREARLESGAAVDPKHLP